MSITAVGAVGGLGVGSVGGIHVAMHPVILQTAAFSPSTKVDISGAAGSSSASDGPQGGSGMSELAHSLITAMMIQMVLGN
ncbi:MAG: hypothetical protein ACOYNZ_09535 [Rhodoferax sp.]